MPSRVHPRAARRLGLSSALLLWAALVCLAAQASGYAHAALVRHVWCAEHGEVAHAAEGAAPHAGLSVVPGAGRESSVVPDGASGAEHEHQHCAAMGLRRVATLRSAAGAPAPSPPTHAAAPCAQYQRPATACTLYALAPKTSPPVGA